MSNIMGLGGSIHDFAACLIHDKNILAIEDERLTRIRYAAHSKNPCHPSIHYCLENAGMALQEIDLLVSNDDIAVPANMLGQCQTDVINHHMTHAYSAFYTSTFDKAAILVVDGAGGKRYASTDSSEERETTTYAVGDKNSVKVIKKIYGDLSGENPITKSQTIMSNSIGEFYRIVAETIELGWLVGPGKTMGLASYGAKAKDDRFVDVMLSCIKFLGNGEFEIKTNGKEGLIDKLYLIRQKYLAHEERYVIDAALAHSGQIVLEQLLSHALNYLASQVDTDNLCIIGGVGLNSIANGKITKLSRFKNIHVLFSPGDSGTAVGAAIGGYLKTQSDKDELVRFKISPYLGKSYQDIEMAEALKKHGLKWARTNNIHKSAAELIAQGKTLAWYQGSSEFGPRALGNRSLLADARLTHMRDHINHKVKQREWFRPLAPAVLEEMAQDYFNALNPSPWMQFVWDVKDNAPVNLPSVTHIDGTARVQSVSKKDNADFHQLITQFYEITGTPAVLNTSLNIKGEPIVETPDEAIQAFLQSPIDALAMGEFLVVKT